MLFNSIEFAVFLPIVFAIYWAVGSKRVKSQNIILLVSSYIFYGWWDFRFLLLIAFSSIVDYFVGLQLGKTNRNATRKALLSTSIFVNIGLLCFFKYFNFFADSLYNSFTLLGKPISDPVVLNIVLPVGISFYTFQTLSYSIDIFRRKLKPTRDYVSFFAFVSFFPQLVAGPIERAINLLPQFTTRREFSYEYAANGMRQILWGLFKKVVIADNCAGYANDIFANYTTYSGSTLALGALFFAFQIYGDFSGYSDIAIGTARLFGFKLMRNFSYPYFSRDIAEFWRRWHISLSTWFKDYLYIPLGGSRGGPLSRIKNVFVIFVVSGFWHGANWTFVLWGALNAIYFVPVMLMGKNRAHTDIVAKGRLLPTIREAAQIMTTFSLTLVAWVIFRAPSAGEALHYLSRMFSPSLFVAPRVFSWQIILWVLILLSVEWFQRHRQHALEIRYGEVPKPIRWIIYYLLLSAIVLAGGSQQQFIYFQF